MYNAAVANSQQLSFKPYITASGILHAGLILLVGLSSYFHWSGNRWAGPGGGNEGVKVKLVGNSGLPMPAPPSVNESNVVDPSKSLWKNDVKPEPPQPKKEEVVPPDLKNVPEFKTLEKPNKRPPPPPRPNKAFEPKVPNPENAVPGKNLGAPKLTTGAGSTPGSSTTPGLAVKSEGGGDFASRYGWYIESVKRRIQGNWMQNTIDPGVRAARTAHSVVQFTISRDGTVKDIRISQSSGNLSMDNSSLRAILSSNPMPGLPPDYSGSYVTVLFDFDLSMTR
jgi:periplasmic protein TonB